MKRKCMLKKRGKPLFLFSQKKDPKIGVIKCVHMELKRFLVRQGKYFPCYASRRIFPIR
jgi:hypothetical protein